MTDYDPEEEQLPTFVNCGSCNLSVFVAGWVQIEKFLDGFEQLEIGVIWCEDCDKEASGDLAKTKDIAVVYKEATAP